MLIDPRSACFCLELRFQKLLIPHLAFVYSFKREKTILQKKITISSIDKGTNDFSVF